MKRYFVVGMGGAVLLAVLGGLAFYWTVAVDRRAAEYFAVSRIVSGEGGDRQKLPHSGSGPCGLLDTPVNSEEAAALQRFFYRNQAALAAIPVETTDAARSYISRRRYDRLVLHKMIQIRGLADFIEGDIARQERDAALRHVGLLRELATLPIGRGGDRAIDVNGAYLLVRKCARIMNNFPLSAAETQGLQKELGQYQAYLERYYSRNDPACREAMAILNAARVGIAIAQRDKDDPDLHLDRHDFLDPWTGKPLNCRRGRQTVQLRSDISELQERTVIRVSSAGPDGRDQGGNPFTGVSRENDDATFILLD